MPRPAILALILSICLGAGCATSPPQDNGGGEPRVARLAVTRKHPSSVDAPETFQRRTRPAGLALNDAVPRALELICRMFMVSLFRVSVGGLSVRETLVIPKTKRKPFDWIRLFR